MKTMIVALIALFTVLATNPTYADQWGGNSYQAVSADSSAARSVQGRWSSKIDLFIETIEVNMEFMSDGTYSFEFIVDCGLCFSPSVTSAEGTYQVLQDSRLQFNPNGGKSNVIDYYMPNSNILATVFNGQNFMLRRVN